MSVTERLGALEELMRELVAEEVARQLAERDTVQDRAVSPWLALEEAAEYLRISERTLERLIEKKRISSTTIGRRRLLHRNELDAFAAAGEETAPTAPPRRRRGVE